jgi:hypothetical protein
MHVSLSIGHAGLSLGGELAASVVASRERGYTWLLHDERAADALVGRLRLSRGELERRIADGRMPSPTQRYGHGGLAADGRISRGAMLGGSLGLSSQDVAGARTDARTGRTTFYVQRLVEGSLSLTQSGTGATATRSDRERYAVTYDARGRPVDLMVMTTGSYRMSVDLPTRLQPAVGLLSAPTGHGRVYVEETHLDLTDPESLRLAGAFLRQVHDRDPAAFGDAVAVAAALRRRIDAVGVVHARTYDADERRYGVDVSAGIYGVRVGGAISRTREDTHLVAATTRGLDGVWRVRRDCLGQRA